ncbi:hypothetical protein ACIQ57_10885 [Lysinibacillus xylanilyticus]|uniref:hypothetical protein n=1 Tax=Lysinibacillus xylanilyticus TaxID=582475 RepID=UPI00381B2FD8
MNWERYLLDDKAPVSDYAHLGLIEGARRTENFDLATLEEDTRIVALSTPLKKSKKKYVNYESLVGNQMIEGIYLTDLDEERLQIFSTLPNLKYLHISSGKMGNIPNLSCLHSLEVLILANLSQVKDLNFLIGLQNLQTLYIFGMNHLYDLTALATLSNLKELSLNHGRMSGTGKPVKSFEPVGKLIKLEYLSLILVLENKSRDITPILKLENIRKLYLLPRYTKGMAETITTIFPNLLNKQNFGRG